MQQKVRTWCKIHLSNKGRQTRSHRTRQRSRPGDCEPDQSGGFASASVTVNGRRNGRAPFGHLPTLRTSTRSEAHEAGRHGARHSAGSSAQASLEPRAARELGRRGALPRPPPYCCRRCRWGGIAMRGGGGGCTPVDMEPSMEYDCTSVGGGVRSALVRSATPCVVGCRLTARRPPRAPPPRLARLPPPPPPRTRAPPLPAAAGR